MSDPITSAQTTQMKRTFWIVFAIVLVDMLGVGILIPVIPLLLTDPSYPYYLALPLSQGFIVLGLLSAIYPFGQFIATPILGQLSDRYGRKPVLAFSIAGTAASYVVFALGIITKNIPLLFISRALDGITGGNVSVAQATIADTTAPEDRAKSFGIIGAAFGIGFIIGPFLGGKLSDPSILSWFNATTPFWFAALLSLFNMIAVMSFLKESLTHPRNQPLTPGQSLRDIQAAFSDRRMHGLFGTAFLFTSGFTFFTTFFGVYLIAKFHFMQGQIGDLFAFIGICIAVTQALVVGFAAKRWSAQKILLFSFLGLTLTFTSFFFAHAPWLMYVITIPNAMFIGLIMANLTGLISRSVGPERQGEILGINSSVQALAQSIPPVIAGFVALLSPGLPLLVAAATMLLAAGLFLTVSRGTDTAS